MDNRMTRREFLGASLGVLAFWAGRSRAQESGKLRMGIIGCGGRGAGNLDGVSSEEIVALCDVDEAQAAGARQRFPAAKFYRDFREMLEAEQLDAVTVSTPDHTHAVAAMAAMRKGLHVYCEKPLTRTVYEARQLREMAAKTGVATQMGNQGSASNGQRESIEIIWSGAIGEVRLAHVWTDRPIWPQGIERPKDTPPVPESLSWDLWLGPAPERPYHPVYLPFKWRGWYDFGTGALGDMMCHNANMLFRALRLGYPTSVESWVEARHAETFPRYATVRFDFPARGDLPPCTLFWHDGPFGPPPGLGYGDNLPSNGSLLIGSEGAFLALNSESSSYKLLPEERFRGYRPPKPTLPRSAGHHADWINACKGGPPAFSSFDHAAFLTEIVALGAVAERVEGRIEWDGPNMRATNRDDLVDLITPKFREGWTL